MGAPTSRVAKFKSAIAKLNNEDIIVQNREPCCKKCAEFIDCGSKRVNVSRIKEHIDTKGHQKRLNNLDQSSIQVSFSKQREMLSDTQKFNRDLIDAFTSANIPIEKLGNSKLKSFIEKYTKQDVFGTTKLRSIVADIADEKLTSLRTTISNNDVYFISDETPELKLIITDGAAYMTKAIRLIKVQCPMFSALLA